MNVFQRINDLPFGIKIGVALAFIGILPVAVGSLILTTTSARALEQNAFEELEALAVSRHTALSIWLEDVRADVHSFSSLPDTVASVAALEAVVEESAGTAGHDATFTELRALYLSQPGLHDAGDGGTYSELHARLNPLFAKYAETHGYEDVKIVAADGDMIYSIEKEDDFATNLVDGPYADTNLALAYRQAAAAQDPDLVMVEDFEIFEATGEPEAYVSSGVFDDNGAFIGVFIIELSADNLNTIMNDRTGLGETGETYLVGPNKLFHNNSRFAADLGVETTVLNPDFRVDTEAANSALAGGTDVKIIEDYRGVDVLSAWQPMQVQAPVPGVDEDGLTWALIAEIDEQEVLQPVRQQRTVGWVLAGIATVLAGGLAYVMSNLLTRQVDEMHSVFRDVAMGNFAARANIYSADELGRTASGVNALLDQMTDLLDAELDEQRRLLETVLDNSPVGVFVVEAPAGTPLLANRQAIEMLGRGIDPNTSSDRLGETYQAYIAGTDTIYPSERMPLVRGLSGRRSRVRDMEVRQADGTRRHLEVQGAPIRDADGDVVASVAVFTDVTEQQELLEQIENQVAILSNLNHFVGIGRLDDGGVDFVNPYGMALVGRQDEDYTQLTIADFHPNDIMNLIENQAIPGMLHNGIWSGQTALEHIDGTRIPVDMTYVLLRDNQGEPYAVGALMRDIRAEQEAQTQIYSQNEALQHALDDLRLVAAEVEATVQEVSIASGSMRNVVELMAGQADSSAEVADQAASSAYAGDEAVNETIASMNRIRTNTQETAQRIKRLGEVTQEVGEATRLIEDLADRTTVLALNASIQAAAAGEAGRGFAVVAEEVQRLAERATGATRQIEDLITNIRAEANQAMVAVEEVTREVVDGSTLAQTAGEHMSTLNQLVEQLSDLIQHLSQTTASQTTESLDALGMMVEGLHETVRNFQTPESASLGGNGQHQIEEMLQS